MKTTSRGTQVIFAAAFVWALSVGSAASSHAQAAGAAIATPAQSTTAPAVGSSIWSGVYSEAQAKRGEATAQRCSACHGSDLTGGEAGPALVGLEFLGNWNQQSLGDLFDRIHSTMPADAPGSLSVQETADIIARVLQLNKFPAAQKELPTDVNALGQIKIESTPPAK